MSTIAEGRPSKLVERFLWFGFFAFAISAGFFQITAADTGFHIQTGAYVFQNRSIPAVNTFAHTTPEHHWYLQQWAPATLFYLVYHWLGLTGLITFKSVICALVFLVTARTAYEAGGKRNLFLALCLGTVAILIARHRFFVRPYIFSALIFASVLWADCRYNRRCRWQWIALPIIMAIWTNTHAGVMYGFVLLCGIIAHEWIEWAWTNRREWKAGEGTSSTRVVRVLKRDFAKLRIRPVGLLLALLLSGISVELINPNGIQVALVPIEQFLTPFWQESTVEYASPTFAKEPIFFVFVGVVVVVQVAVFRTCHPLKWILLNLGFGYLALRSQRSIFVYTLVATPYAACLFDALFRQAPSLELLRTGRARCALLLGAWLLLPCALFLRDPICRPAVGFTPRFYPLKIYDLIRESIEPQKMFHDMRFGGSMLWFLYPDFRPFIDGRGTCYSIEFWKNDYLKAMRAEDGWESIFERYDITIALLSITTDHRVPKLGHVLFAHPDWACVAYNDDAILFLKRTTENMPVIERLECRSVWPGDLSLGSIGSLAGADAEAERAFVFSPESNFSRAAYARSRLTKGDYNTAVALYAALIELPDASEGFWRDYLFALFRSGQVDRAEAVSQKMISKGIASDFAWYIQHFLILHSRQDMTAAMGALQKAINIAPADAGYRNRMAQLKATSTPVTQAQLSPSDVPGVP